MSETNGVMTGMGAINALNDEGGSSGGGIEFSSFKSGSTYKVRVLNTQDVASAFTYGIYKKINSFSAENPSKKSAKGYPVANLTPWDLAWKYHKDLSEDFSDEHGQEAAKYKCKQRFAMRFFDLDTGEPIIVDLSKNQAQAVYSVILKNEKKLGKKAFELEKAGKGTSTTVTLSPEDLEDLTDKQRENFDNAPMDLDPAELGDVFVTKTEAEQVELLKEAGFDVSLIGLDGEQAGGDQADAPAESEDDDPTSQF